MLPLLPAWATNPQNRLKSYNCDWRYLCYKITIYILYNKLKLKKVLQI